MLLRNHGTLTVGRTCADAFLRMYFLERACSMQVRARSIVPTGDDYPIEASVLEKNARLTTSPEQLAQFADKLVWPALIRRLDRNCPDYRT